MAYAEKRAGTLTGFWYGEHVSSTHERFRRRFETKREAQGYEAYVKTVGAEPVNLKDAKLAGPTFAAVAQMCRDANEQWKRGRDPGGQKRLDWVIGFLGATPIENVDTNALDRLVANLAARPAQVGDGKLSKGTINRYLSAASAVLKFARERALIKVQPVVPWQKEGGKRIEFFSEAQEDAVVRWLTGQGHLPSALTVGVLCASGLRWGEFISLEPHQCQGEWIKLDRTKTDTPRDVPIADALAGELRSMILANKRPDYRTFRTQLKAAAKACGYSPKLGIHNCRHTTATRLIKLGVALPIVQKFLGHKSITTTMRYVHVESDDLMGAMKKLHPRRGETANYEVATVLPFASKAV
jgi:integrase